MYSTRARRMELPFLVLTISPTMRFAFMSARKQVRGGTRDLTVYLQGKIFRAEKSEDIVPKLGSQGCASDNQTTGTFMYENPSVLGCVQTCTWFLG